jgi:prophage tail gpP-like protein
MTKFSVVCNGREFENFGSIAISNSIEAICGFFSIRFMQKNSVRNNPLDIPLGNEVVEIFSDGKLRLRAYLESVEADVGGDGRSITYAGRELTCDLVDCTIEDTRTINGPLKKVIQELCSGFPKIGFEQVSGLGNEVVSTRTQPSETYWKTIERLSRKAGALLWSSGDGVVRIGSVKAEKIDLVLDSRVIRSARSQFNSSQIYTRYVIKGESEPSEGSWGQATKAKWVHNSDFLKRQRTLCVRGESTQSKADTKQRATWESNIRISRAVRAQIQLRGLTAEAIRLIECNKIISIDYPDIGIQRDMLILGYNQKFDSAEGETFDVDLALPGSIDPEPFTTAETKKELGKNIIIW